MEGNVIALLALAAASVITVSGVATLKNKQIERDTKISDQAEQISSLKDDLSQKEADNENLRKKCDNCEKEIQTLTNWYKVLSDDCNKKIKSLNSDLSQKRK